MDTVEILSKARELISDESRWTRYKYARNSKGKPVKVNDPTATCFCMYGAIAKVMGKSDTMDDELYSITEKFAARLGYSYPQAIFAFNDTHSHSAVLAAFDRAIELAKAGS